MSIGGILLGYYLYERRKDIPERLAKEKADLYDLVLNKYYVDEAYQKAVVDPLLEINEAAGRFDNGIIDGAVNGTASGLVRGSVDTGYFDNEVIDGGVNGTGAVVGKAGSLFRKIQTGNIKTYITSALAGGLFVIAAFCAYLTWYGG